MVGTFRLYRQSSPGDSARKRGFLRAEQSTVEDSRQFAKDAKNAQEDFGGAFFNL